MAVDESVILERIDALRGDILEVKEEIKATKESADRSCKVFNDFQLLYTKEYTKLDGITLDLIKDVTNHGIRLKSLEDLIKPLIFQNRIVAGIGGILLLSIIGLLYSIFTHQMILSIP